MTIIRLTPRKGDESTMDARVISPELLAEDKRNAPTTQEKTDQPTVKEPLARITTSDSITDFSWYWRPNGTNKEEDTLW